MELKSSNLSLRSGRTKKFEWSKVELVAVEVSTVGSMPPVAAVVRISKGEGSDFGAAALFSTETLSLQGRAGSSTFTPKLVEHIESGST